jgi:hypothetical protein
MQPINQPTRINQPTEPTRAIAIYPDRKVVEASSEDGIKFFVGYDKLAVCTGSQGSTFGIPGVEQHTHFLRDLRHAEVGALWGAGRTLRAVGVCMCNCGVAGVIWLRSVVTDNMPICILHFHPAGHPHQAHQQHRQGGRPGPSAGGVFPAAAHRDRGGRPNG